MFLETLFEIGGHAYVALTLWSETLDKINVIQLVSPPSDGVLLDATYPFYPGEVRQTRSRTEGVRFELTRPFGLPVFKTGAINRSATPPRRMSRQLCHRFNREQL